MPSYSLAPWHDLDTMLDKVFPTWENAKGTVHNAKLLADLIETENDYRIELDIPGMSKKDISISVDKGIVSISGERTIGIDKETEKTLYSERHRGSFKRTIQLTEQIDQTNIKATLEQGVLTLVLPKSTEAQSKKIVIE